MANTTRSKLTKLGIELRKIRLYRGMLLKDMADMLKVKSSYLSAIEHGSREIPSDFIIRLSQVMNLSEEDKRNLKNNEILSRDSFKIEDVPEDRRDIAYQVARRLDTISEEQLEALKIIFGKD